MTEVLVAVAVEGHTDLAAVDKLMSSHGIEIDGKRAYVLNGKDKLDRRISSYNESARRTPWFVLRDSDRDGDDCPVRLRDQLLNRRDQSNGLCLRIAVRSLEAWLLADAEAIARVFGVRPGKVPKLPEELDDAKAALVDLCRKSTSSVVRRAMVPPARTRRRVGPEYVTFVSEFCREHWRPQVAAERAPSLSRALRSISEWAADC